MASRGLRNFTLTSVFLVGVAACGGGTQLAGGGIGGTGISQGSITGFGSVWVNGVEFDTTNAAILRDGSTITQSDLALGMVVTVDGTINSDGVSGTATAVNYTKELQGPISEKPTNNSIIVLGQTVIIDDLTKIIVQGNAATIDALQLNDVVEVSGFLAAGGIRATYIEVKSQSTDVELDGVITAIKSDTIIAIGSQEINISAVPTFTPAINDYVEVKGSLFLAGSALQATSIEKKSRSLGTGSADRAELEGFITSVTSGSDFKVDGQQVQTTAQTVFIGGAAADIKTGIRLEIKGALSNGLLVAAKVNFEDNLTLEGNIISVNPNNNTVILDTYPDISIEVNDVLTEGSGTSYNVGDYIKIRGRKLDHNCVTKSCTLLATELEVEMSGGGGSGGSAFIESYATVDAVDKNNQTITVLGNVLYVSAIPSFSGQDSAGNEITTIAEFFNAIKLGDVVDLKGTNINGAITWVSIELED